MNRRNLTKAILASCVLPSIPNNAPLAGGVQSPLNLKIVTRTLDVNGRAAKVFGLTGPSGSSGLELTAGGSAQVNLTNTTVEETMIHWHGLTPAWDSDGVPGLPMPLLKPGETRRYMLPTGRPGTHWMHAHTLQEQALLAAPLIVRGDDVSRDEQEVVVLLHDFSFTSAEELLAKLKSGTDMGMTGHMNMRGMNHSGMPGMNMGAMMGMDVNDIEYDAYLANDRTLSDPEVHRVERRGRVRLRVINGATATAFTIDPGQLGGQIIAVDGQDIVPQAARPFPLAMGQRVDFHLNVPKEGGAFPILALREGAVQRTGVILATPGAHVGRMAETGDVAGPILSLDSEALVAAASHHSASPADRRFTVNLFGNMQGYAWGIEADSALVVRQGERVAIEMRNHSMMMHPMHLHGHHFQVVAINGRHISGAVRDTVFLTPMTSVTFAFDAINSGKAWPFHCHHLYHMASGMMTTIGYE